MRQKTILPTFAFLCAMFLLTGCTKDPDSKSGCNHFELHEVFMDTQLPHQVNVLFQVFDKNGKGYPGLTTERFEVTENGDDVGAEGSLVVEPNPGIPSEVKTALFLDISGSVSGVFSQLKQAAIEFVNNRAPNQKIAIYTFDSQVTLRQDFTQNTTLLTSAINSLSVGSNSTNLYGAVAEASYLDDSDFTLDLLRVSNAVVFTDGKETTGEYQYQYALNSAQYATIFTVGLNSPDLDETPLKAFAGSGKRYIKADNIENLKNAFLEVQKDIDLLSRSVYWLYYQSPKRGYNTHTLRLSVKDNCNTYYDAVINSSFSSENFTD